MTNRALALFASVLLFIPLVSVAQWSNPTVSLDPNEIRLTPTWKEPNAAFQSRMRGGPFWSQFRMEHPHWQVQFDPSTGTVHRAYGPSIDVVDAAQWLEDQLLVAGWTTDVADWTAIPMGKHILHRSHQVVAGRPVFGSEFVIKTGAFGVISWGAQCHPGATWPNLSNSLSEEALTAAATDDLVLENMAVTLGGEWLLPVPTAGETITFDHRAVREIEVRGISDQGVPVQYRTLVDQEDGTVWLRQNEVKHVGHPKGPRPAHPKPMGPPALMQMMECQITATVHLTQPFDPPVEVGLGHLQVQTAQGTVTASDGGMVVLDTEQPQEMGLHLYGLWSTVTTEDVTPSFDVAVAGDTVISFDGEATIRELSAYYNVNRIHDHVNTWLPDFDGLDFSLPTRVDVNGTCNAFYTPGSPSINFYSEGDGCSAFSTVSDVVFHEYGHGINDLYYESLGGNFTNGGVNEGYADFWAISLTGNPVLGAGCYLDNEDFFIRRYDENPKVYPQDLVGEVHADGEIICGAWYDTHLLMGGDWNATMALFVAAFPGMQAQTQNGNEGEAFVEILLDVLQADDDDDDLSNGTPNGSAILEGFGLHGISLFSSVDIEHEAIEFAAEAEAIPVEAEAAILFPFGQYFNTCDLHYRTSPFEDWTVIPMEPGSGDLFQAEVPAQEPGTVIEYYFGISDLFGSTSAITPFSAEDAANPNLPFNIIVGLEPVLIDNQDDYNEFGFWEVGLPEDNAETGEWESAQPVGSYGTPGDPTSICAPAEDHTPGDGLYAFVTGVSPGGDAGIGSNDVDAGSTTLQSQTIDLSEMVSPVLSYWRWYVNAPPSGANPGADWWQVHVSEDGGQNWVEIEETLTQDIRWRRNAFAIQDYVDLTDEFKIRFVASDSIRPGQELEGGSLIEAAVDDLLILDVASLGVEDDRVESAIVAWPVPCRDRVHAAGWAPMTCVRLLDAAGKVVAEEACDSNGQVHFDLPQGLTGSALMTGMRRSGEVGVKKVMLLRE